LRDQRALLSFDLGDLRDSPFMSPTLEAGSQEHVHDRQRQFPTEYPAPERQHICVVVLTCQSSHELVATQRRTYAVHLVRSDLLALPAATEDDA
jgi:hypothetical protein